MPFRYRSSIRLLPGLHVNLSKSGASLSVGGRDATVNLGKRGVRTTVGLPGSGISYSETKPWHRHNGDQADPRRRARPSGWPVVLIFLAPLALSAALKYFGGT